MEPPRPPDSLRCPCCGEPCSGSASMLARIEAEVAAAFAPAGAFNALRPPGWSVEAARSGRLRWACRQCLQSGRALPGDPALQTWCDHEPYFAFIDAKLSCEDCGQAFLFAAAEQRYWYETLKFLVQSRPKQCAPCRRERRARRRADREGQGRPRDDGG